MKKHDYIKIILEGYIHNKSFLSEHFYREFKIAETKYIGLAEFTTGLKDGIELFLSDIKRQYYERLKEVALIMSLRKEKGESIDDLDDQRPEMDDFYAHLGSITSNSYVGHISLDDLSQINDAAVQFIVKCESGGQQEAQLVVRNESIQADSINPYPDIFINYSAYEMFEKLIEAICTNNYHYANYSFIMSKMITDGYLKKTKHLELIEFLDNHDKYTKKNPIGSKYEQFKTSETAPKSKLYSTINNTYKDKIKPIVRNSTI